MKSLANIFFYLEDEIDIAALERAAQVAQESGARLTMATVVEPARLHAQSTGQGYEPNEIEKLIIEERQDWLEDARSLITGIHPQASVRVLVGDPIEAVLETAQSEGIDLLIKTPSPKQNLRQQLFGSIDMHLMRGCPCPVLIARTVGGDYSGCAVAAVSYDVDDEIHTRLNHEILDAAAFVLKTQFAAMKELHVVHVWKLYGESMLTHGRAKLPADKLQAALREEEELRSKWLDKLINEYRDNMDEATASAFNPKVSLLHGDPKIVLPEYIKKVNAEVLAMGTVARVGISGLFIGNTAEEILNRVNCSVVTHKITSPEATASSG